MIVDVINRGRKCLDYRHCAVLIVRVANVELALFPNDPSAIAEDAELPAIGLLCLFRSKAGADHPTQVLSMGLRSRKRLQGSAIEPFESRTGGAMIR